MEILGNYDGPDPPHRPDPPRYSGGRRPVERLSTTGRTGNATQATGPAASALADGWQMPSMTGR